jgi:hypothetical protein
VVAEFKVVNWCAFGADRSLIIIGSDKRSTILPGCAFVGISIWHDEQVWRRSAAVVECLGDVPDDASDGISLVDGCGQLTHVFGEEDEETQEMLSLWPALPSEISLRGT